MSGANPQFSSCDHVIPSLQWLPLSWAYSHAFSILTGVPIEKSNFSDVLRANEGKGILSVAHQTPIKTFVEGKEVCNKKNPGIIETDA